MNWTHLNRRDLSEREYRIKLVEGKMSQEDMVKEAVEEAKAKAAQTAEAKESEEVNRTEGC